MKKEKKYQVFAKAREIAEIAIKKFPDKLGHVELDKVQFVLKNTKTVGPVHASIEGTRPYWRLFVPQHYTIIINSANWNIASDEFRMYVIAHELYHIVPGGHLKDSSTFCKVRKHDIQDFGWMRELCGIQLQKLTEIMGKTEEKIETPKDFEEKEDSKSMLTFSKKIKRGGKEEKVSFPITF